jgi:predicted nuclease of predicted toxin-antitoxin system
MKVLIDTCVWGGARVPLEAAGHDVVWAGTWVPDPGDEEILRRAREEGRILITLDKDFGELVFLRGMRHAGLVRLVGIPARQQGVYASQILEQYGKELAAGAIITAEPGRLRIRTSDSGDGLQP